MPRRKREEQDFLENIERLIAGEGVSIGEDTDEDLRTAIEFSRRLSDLHTGPSVEFKDKLKSRLLLKLTEQEVAARQRVEKNWFRDILDRLVPQSPVWRTATVTLVMIVAVVTVMWRTGMFTGVPVVEGEMLKGVARDGEQVAAVMEAEVEEAAVEAPLVGLTKESPAPTLEVAMVSLFDMQVTPSESTIAEYGHEVSYQLTFSNTSDETIVVTPFPPRFTIAGDGTLRPVRIMTEGDRSIEVGASASIVYVFTWDQRDDDDTQVPADWYTVYTGTVTVTGSEQSSTVDFPPLPRILVQSP
ncbi:MAG: hypothetical protein ISS55_00435 [Dehalococcoidales bacterium]|nr:hypothetical protein [Dehalococcoidales bacterium]